MQLVVLQVNFAQGSRVYHWGQVGYLPVLEVDLLDHVVLAARAEQLVEVGKLAAVRNKILQVAQFALQLTYKTG